MADAKALVLQNGRYAQIADADALIVGDGVATPSGSSNDLTFTPDGGDVVIVGNILPTGTVDIGSSGSPWDVGYFNEIYSNDVCFFDECCPLCGEEFEEGDDVVFRIYKQVDLGGRKASKSVPAHASCAAESRK